MFFTFSESIWLYPVPIDFRKQIDGIIIMVADHLNLNPASGQLFFYSAIGRRISLKYYGGIKMVFSLFYKRLEKEI